MIYYLKMNKTIVKEMQLGVEEKSNPSYKQQLNNIQLNCPPPLEATKNLMQQIQYF